MRKSLWLLWGYSLKSKSRVFSKACMITSDLTWERGEAEVGCTEVSIKNSEGIQWNICHGCFFLPLPLPLHYYHVYSTRISKSSVHTSRSEWVSEWAVSTDICKGFMDNPAETPPTDLFFFFSLACARAQEQLSLGRSGCPRAAFSETILLEDYTAASGHLVSDRMRRWKKKKNTGIGGAPFSRNTVVDRRVPQKG